MSLRGEDALILAQDYVDETLKGAGALKGQDGVSPVISVNTSTADTYKLDITDKNGTITTPNLVGKQGERGEVGETGADGETPTITENADNTEEVYKLDFTTKNGTFTTKNIIGKQGLEGVSPSVTTNPDNTAEDYRLNITTKGGTFTTPNLRGPQGEIGPQGESAASAINPRGDYDVNAEPHYAVSDYITSSEGNTYVCKKDNPDNVAPTDGTINDEFWQVLALRGAKGESGKDGEKGADGVTFTPSIDANGVLSFTNNGGLENPEPIDIKGDNGVTFTPSIDTDGYLSFTNDGNLENPEPIKVLGKDGEDGKDGIDGTTYIPSISTVTTVESNVDASAGVTVDEETKEAVFHFEIPKGEKAVQFTPSITENGELAWENDGDLENPPTTPIQTLISTAPLGTVLSFAGSNAPNGYLLCDGKSYAVADYEDLYAVIGNTYGGDSTNFNVPNLVDKFIQGSNTSGTEKEAGLPNITGEFGYTRGDNMSSYTTSSGAFTVEQKNSGSYSGSSNTKGAKFAFDASKSNAIYGNSDTVQPPALTMVYIIKAKHTNEGQDEGVSDSVIDYVDGKIIDTTSSTTSTYSSAKIDTELAKKESVYIADSSVNLLYHAAVYLGADPVQYGLYNVTITDDKGNFGEFNFVYKHTTLIYGYIISENGITLAGINNTGTLAIASTSEYKKYRVKYLGIPTEDMTAMPNGGYTRANRNALVSEIVGKKTMYAGNQSVDINTGGKLTFIFSSTYSTSAGCYILLSNYNVAPTLIKLGGHPEERFKVTAVNKSNSVDTITVTTGGDEYTWYVLQF